MSGRQLQAHAGQDYDLYAILDVPSSASTALIKSRFKQQALRCHPDKVAEHERERATQRCQLLLEAYRVLTNDASRQRYDSDRAAKAQAAPLARPRAAAPNMEFVKRRCFGCDGFCVPADMRRCPDCPQVCASFICPSCDTCAACDCASPTKRRRAPGADRSPVWAEDMCASWACLDRFGGGAKTAPAKQQRDPKRPPAAGSQAKRPSESQRQGSCQHPSELRKQRSSVDGDWFGDLVSDASSSWLGSLASGKLWRVF